MLIRIVRMTFQVDKVEEFRNIFNNVKQKIRNFPGCNHLELHQDYHSENIFSTYSHWENDEALNNYRKSELFTEVWKQTKTLFLKHPIAYSNKPVDKVDYKQ